jgi:Ca-activated chloride channel homolog
MAGRHSQPSSARRGMSLPVVAAILLLVAACTAGILVYFNNGGSAHKAGGSSCDGKVTIFLDAAPSIADPVEAIAKKWVATNPTAGGKCVAVNVNSLPSANVEQILASGGNSGGGSSASVWIPDSSTWAARLNDDLAGGSRTGQIEIHAPIASSPLVFVSSPKIVSTFTTKPDWKAALKGQFPLTVPDPVSNTDGLLSLQSMNSVAGSTSSGPNPDVANLMLRLSHSTLADANSGFAQLAADPSRAEVFTAPEQAVIQANRAKQSLFAAAIYPDEGTLSLDYPVVRLVRSGDDPALTAALDALEQQLRTPAAHTFLADAGFRDATGASVPGVGAAEGVAAAPIRQMSKPSAGEGIDTLRLWEAVTDDVNTLTLMDVSGSMAEAGGNGKSKIQLASEAAANAVNFYPDSSNVGMWSFNTRSTPTGTDYTPLVPIGPMDAAHRKALIDAAAQLPLLVQPRNTSLYDSLLAAVNNVRHNYDPSKANTVVLITDGQNDNASGLKLSELITALKSRIATLLPVPVFTIGVGPFADLAGLGQIAKATGGKSYAVKDPTDIRNVFLNAIVQRRCQPTC